MALILRSLLALCLVLASSFVTAQDTEIPLVCHDGVQIIGVVGGNVPNGTNSYGLTVTFVKYLMSDIPDSANFSVNYNRFHDVNNTAATFIPEVDEGVPALLHQLTSYTAACPNTPIVIHGYSEGAVVVMNLLCGASSGWFPVTSPLNSAFASHIIAVILYGDETRTANQPYNYGTCTANSPHLPRRSPEGCAAYAPTIQSYCFDNDALCCATANASAPWPYGINPHYLYPSGYDNTAVSFVIDQYNKYKNGTLYPSSTSTSTVPASTSSSTTSSVPQVVTTSSKTTTIGPVSSSTSTSVRIAPLSPSSKSTSTTPVSSSSSKSTSTAPTSSSSSKTSITPVPSSSSKSTSVPPTSSSSSKSSSSSSTSISIPTVPHSSSKSTSIPPSSSSSSRPTSFPPVSSSSSKSTSFPPVSSSSSKSTSIPISSSSTSKSSSSSSKSTSVPSSSSWSSKSSSWSSKSTSTAPASSSTSKSSSVAPASSSSSSTKTAPPTSTLVTTTKSTPPISHPSSTSKRTPPVSSLSSTITSAPPISTSNPALTSVSTRTHRALTVQPSCTMDKCLSSFAAHPTIAFRYCYALNGGVAAPTNTPFPTVCAGDYASRVRSACDCVVLPTDIDIRSKTKTKTKTNLPKPVATVVE